MEEYFIMYEYYELEILEEKRSYSELRLTITTVKSWLSEKTC